MRKPCFVLFLLAWAASSAALWVIVEPAVVSWIDSVLVLMATASTLLRLVRRLPLQNVLMAALVIAFISAGAVWIGAISGWPFGSFGFTERLGAKLFGTVPWPIPLLWIVIILNARAVAELILKPWRRAELYGYAVLGVACLLAVLLDLGLEPFAVQVKAFWIWNSTPSTLPWHTAPWVNFLGWIVISLMGLVLSVPWLINKRPVQETSDLQPLFLWSLLNVWLALGHAAHQLWSPFVLTVVGGVTVLMLAARGVRCDMK
ncbi:MAG TPA: carotenoid biosynthesis protein [Verrucomicrobiae bacterium]|jgi:putative membrane protein